MTDALSQALREGDLAKALAATVEAFSCQAGTLHFLNPTSGLLELAASHHIPEPVQALIRQVPVGKGIAGVAAERREPVSICNIQADASGVTRPGAKATGMEGAVAVPILVADELLGVLGVAKATAYDWPKEETDRLMHIAAQFGHTKLD